MNIVEPIRDPDKIKEIHQYLKTKSDRDALMFSFGIYTGLRISDILKFRVRDCLKKNYSIREQKTGKQKRFRKAKRGYFLMGASLWLSENMGAAVR